MEPGHKTVGILSAVAIVAAVVWVGSMVTRTGQPAASHRPASEAPLRDVPTWLIAPVPQQAAPHPAADPAHAAAAPEVAYGSAPLDRSPDVGHHVPEGDAVASGTVGPPSVPAVEVRFRAATIGGEAPGRRNSYNTLEGFRWAAEEGVRTAEGDFRLTADGALVAAHDDELRGECGSVRESTLAQLRSCDLDGYHVAALTDVLPLAFDELFIDLKDSQARDHAGWAAHAASAIRRAIADVAEAGRVEDVVLMVYEPLPEWVEEMNRAGVRGGLKGYPRTPAEAMALNRVAAEFSFELVCINLAFSTPEVIADAAGYGIWHLAWDTGRPNVDLWRSRAKAGLGGLISHHYWTAEREVAPHFRPASGR